MKAITIENLVTHIRPLRTGKTFLSNFINSCEIIDVISMENIDKMIAEINQIPLAFTSAFEMKNDALNIINKYCKEDI